MSVYLQGRKIAVTDFKRPSVETLHLICKLRWMGMEEEAEQLQMKTHEAASIGRVITVVRETD